MYSMQCHNPELFPSDKGGGGECMQHFLHDSVALLSLRNAKIATAGRDRDLQAAEGGSKRFQLCR